MLMFVALEVLSLPLYLMAGLARRRRLLSQEAAVKYFLLGAFASAFFLYGVALLYGFAGSVDLGEVPAATDHRGQQRRTAVPRPGMLAVGLLFKFGAAPFQAWTPDVYQGAPDTGDRAHGGRTKISAFGALLRVFYVGFGPAQWDWRPMLWAVAILTMVIGACPRGHPDRREADAGLLLGRPHRLPARRRRRGQPRGPVGHAVLPARLRLHDDRGVRRRDARARQRGRGDPPGAVDRPRQRSPLVAGTFAFLLLALAGIPLTSGFMAKFAVFIAGVESGATALVIVGVVTSAVTAFFYARVIVLMFFSDPAADGPTVAVPSAFTAGGSRSASRRRSCSASCRSLCSTSPTPPRGSWR